MGRDAEAARIRLAVSDPLPARQRQQTAREKQCFKTGLLKNFFFFSHSYKPTFILSIILLKTQQT
jgi:hypothetical protein